MLYVKYIAMKKESMEKKENLSIYLKLLYVLYWLMANEEINKKAKNVAAWESHSNKSRNFSLPSHETHTHTHTE